jgi:hypothetical protein
MALNTLQGYNSNSSSRTGLQRVFVRPKHLYTRRPLSLPRTVPPLHVCSSHVLWHTAPSAPKPPTISPWSRRSFRDILLRSPPFPNRGAPDARRFWFLHTFGAESQPSALSAPKASTVWLVCSCTTKLTQLEQHQRFH